METIKKRFLYYKKYSRFKRDLYSKVIAQDSIVFIEDSNIIWAYGHEYKCGTATTNSGNGSTGEPGTDSSTYITKEQVKEILDELDYVDLDYIKKNFVDWISVYYGDDNGSTGTNPGDGNSQNGSKATNLITLTVKEYQALVDSGNVQKDVYYFTYEDESSSWVFGNKFPIILNNKESTSRTFGSPLPIILS